MQHEQDISDILSNIVKTFTIPSNALTAAEETYHFANKASNHDTILQGADSGHMFSILRSLGAMLVSEDPPLKLAAIAALYNLTRHAQYRESMLNTPDLLTNIISMLICNEPKQKRYATYALHYLAKTPECLFAMATTPDLLTNLKPIITGTDYELRDTALRFYDTLQHHTLSKNTDTLAGEQTSCSSTSLFMEKRISREEAAMALAELATSGHGKRFT